MPSNTELEPKRRFMHLRFRPRVLEDDSTIHNRGGATVVFDITAQGTLQWAFTICSKADNFSREAGRHWAVDNAEHGKFWSETTIRKEETLQKLIDNLIKPSIYKEAVHHGYSENNLY